MNLGIRKPHGSMRVLQIGLSSIRANPGQPRKVFDPSSLDELAESIRTYGVLSPLTVRQMQSGFELVAGERRLRAAALAGLTEVPCIVIEADNLQSSLIALVENLQRQDLGFMEEAEGLARLIRIYGLSQEEAARRVGKSQSAVANKLRLLRHPPEVLSLISEYGLTERHARALLRIENLQERALAAKTIGKRGLNVSQADQYVENLLVSHQRPSLADKIRPLYIIKDIRLFLNTLDRAVSIMHQAGVPTQLERAENENEIVLTIRIPRQKSLRREIG